MAKSETDILSDGEVRLAPEHLALLFLSVGQPPPPALADSFQGIPAALFAEKVRLLEAEMLARGLLVTATGGESEPCEEVADLMGLCLDAGAAVTVEDKSKGLATFYLSHHGVASVLQIDGEFAVHRLPAGDEGAWLASFLDDEHGSPESGPFTVLMTIEQMDMLLAAPHDQTRSMLDAYYGAADERANQAARVLEVVRAADSPLKVTAALAEHDGVACSQVVPTAGGAWILRVVVMSESDIAELGWWPTAELAARLIDLESSAGAHSQ